MNNPWPTVRLGDVLKPMCREESVDASKNYRLLGVRWYAGGMFAKNVKSGHEIRADKLYRVHAGDFIYNRLFAWKGSFAVAAQEDNNGYVSNEFPCFEVMKERADCSFLFWYFNQETSWQRALGLSSGATPTSRNRLKEQDFLKLIISLPSLAEQRRIAGRIDGIAAQIRLARTIREQQATESKQLLAGVFWEIAKNAPRRSLGDVAPLVRRPVTAEPDALYPELGIRSFGNGTFHKPALTGLEVGTKRIFEIEPGDLIFSNVFAWEGAIAVATKEDTGRFGSHRFMTCIPKPSVATAEFLCFYFLTQEGLELIRSASPGGAGRNRTLGISALANIKVPVPAIEAQHRFDALVAETNGMKRLQAESTAELDALLPSVLSKAFAGEL